MIVTCVSLQPTYAEAPQPNIEIKNETATTTPVVVIKKQIKTTIPAEVQPYSKEEVIELIKKYSAEYGIDSGLPLRVAQCEGGYRWDAKNPNSSASGVFQYIASTWRNTEEGRKGTSPFDAEANVRMAVRAIATGGIGHWNESKNCWKNKLNEKK